jgi:ketosteroid isomerase-like protein
MHIAAASHDTADLDAIAQALIGSNVNIHSFGRYYLGPKSRALRRLADWTNRCFGHVIAHPLRRFACCGNVQQSKKGGRMNYTKAWWVFGLLSLVGAASSQAQQTGTSPEQAVSALENRWLQSYKTNNPDLIAPMLAEKFVSTGADGKLMNKTESLAEAKATKNTSADYETMQVTVFGDTAIATGGYKGKGMDSSGKPFDVHLQWTDTWVKMPNGKWQCVASQDTPIQN